MLFFLINGKRKLHRILCIMFKKNKKQTKNTDLSTHISYTNLTIFDACTIQVTDIDKEVTTKNHNRLKY